MCSEEYEESSEVLPGEVELQRAWAAIQLKRWDEAVEWSVRSIAEDPEDSNAFKFLSIGLTSLHKFDDALKAAEDGLALDPDDEWLHRLRAISLLNLDKKEEALYAAREAVRLEPENAAAHHTVGLVYHNMEMHGQARESARKALELAPDDNDYHRFLGDLFMESEPRKAEKYYRQALAIDPTDAHALNNLGVVLQEMKMDAEATTAYKAALLLDPNMTAARQNVHASVKSLKRFTTYSGIGFIIAFAVIFKNTLRTGRVWYEMVSEDPGQVLYPLAVVLGIVGIAGSIILVKYLLWRKKLAAIEEKDPQLFEIYQKLEQDRKLGRL